MRAASRLLLSIALLCSSGAHAQLATQLPESAQQGSLILGQTRPGSTVTLHGNPVRVATDGRFAFGIGRDESRNARVAIIHADGTRERIDIAIKKRDWPVERVTGWDTHIPLFRLEMKYLPSVERIVAAARRAVAHG